MSFNLIVWFLVTFYCCFWPIYFEFDRDKNADGIDDISGQRRGQFYYIQL